MIATFMTNEPRTTQLELTAQCLADELLLDRIRALLVTAAQNPDTVGEITVSFNGQDCVWRIPGDGRVISKRDED